MKKYRDCEMYIRKSFRLALASSVILFVGACGPIIKSAKIKEEIQPKFPSHLKIVEVILDDKDIKEEYSKFSGIMRYEAPFKVKLTNIEAAYSEVKKEVDYRKEGNVVFVELFQEKGATYEVNGNVVKEVPEKGTEKFTARCMIPDGLPLESFAKGGSSVIVIGSEDEKAYKDGYKKMLERMPEFLSGVWLSDDGGKLVYDKSKILRLELKSGELIKRTWSISDDGEFITRDGAGQGIEKIVRINDSQWICAYANQSGLSPDSEKFKRKKITSFDELEKQRVQAAENFAKYLPGIWSYENGRATATFYSNGTYEFGKDKPGTWRIDGDEIILNDSDGISYYKQVQLDNKSFEMQSVKENSRESQYTWRGVKIGETDFQKKAESAKTESAKMESAKRAEVRRNSETQRKTEAQKKAEQKTPQDPTTQAISNTLKSLFN